MNTERIIINTEKKSYITPEIQVIDTSITNVILASEVGDANDKIDTDEVILDL